LRSHWLRWLFVMLAMISIASSAQALEIRGSVAGSINGQDNLAYGSFTWNPQNFAGFYYDIKKDIGTETLTTTLTEGNKLSGDMPYGAVYITTAQQSDFEFEDWGRYNVIAFLGQKHFAGYIEGYDGIGGILYQESTDENSLADEQLQAILIDRDNETILMPGTPLELAEGYELAVKYIDENGLYLELSKYGAVIDSKVMSPSREGATMLDKTYYYARDEGEQKNLVIIAAHFKNALRIENQTVATVDGLWQISDEPVEVKADTQYDKMTIRYVDANAGVISMDNNDEAITLSKNKETVLMPGISLRTADNDTLRYYIFSEVTCE
jgi:S-layer protein (TIGR01567 family)